MKYLAIDNETGGLGDNVSLLTTYLAVLDKDLRILDELYLEIKPEDGVYRIEPQALAINKIDLVIHDKTAETKSIAGQKLFKFLRTNSADGADKLIPFGHNVIFDVISLHKELLNRPTFEKFTSYRKLDTAVIAQFLKLAGKIPDEVSGSLSSLAKFFGITNKQAHNAREDVVVTIEVLKSLLKLVEGK